MKNSTYFRYKNNGRSIEEFLKETTGRNSTPRPVIQEYWRCAWCAHDNAIGLNICEHCHMPREENP